MSTAPDLRPPVFRQAVHVDDLSNPKRPKIETRHRESIIAPGKRIEASDRTYYTDAAGSLRRVHREGDTVSIVSRRSKAKPATKAQQKGAARIEAAIAKREGKRARRLAAKERRREAGEAKITREVLEFVQALHGVVPEKSGQQIAAETVEILRKGFEDGSMVFAEDQDTPADDGPPDPHPNCGLASKRRLRIATREGE